jgi:hypothetical protein
MKNDQINPIHILHMQTEKVDMVDRSIDPDKLNTLLASRPNHAEYIKKIVDNTLYVTTEEMIQRVRDEFLKFINNHKNTKYNLFISNPRNIGSEHMLLLAMEDLLHPVEVLYGYKKKLSNSYPIIIFDDAIYSSVSMCEHADLLQHFGNKNTIHCFVAFLNSPDVQVNTDFNVIIHASVKLDHLVARNLLPGVNVYKVFGCESEFVLPIYFDHKIANSFGSYQFYHDIIKNPISREIIDRITPLDIKNFITRMIS